jgi:hypothetical protein
MSVRAFLFLPPVLRLIEVVGVGISHRHRIALFLRPDRGGPVDVLVLILLPAAAPECEAR